jgi:O-antigen/teichoic acid export membrane protein
MEAATLRNASWISCWVTDDARGPRHVTRLTDETSVVTMTEQVPSAGTSQQSLSRFWRNVARIATGTVASQALVLLATPILTRLFRPEEFGALAVFTAAYAVVAGLTTLKFELAIILPPDPRRAVDLTKLAIATCIATSSLLLLGLLLCRWLFGVLTEWYYLLVPLSAILGAIYTSAQQWSARANDYSRYARAQVLNSVANVATCLVLALVSQQLSGSLVIGYLTGMAIAMLYLGAGMLRATKKVAQDRSEQRSMLAVAREFKRFPLYVLPSYFLASVGTSGPAFILQALFSLREVGHYAIAARFLLIPGALVGGAISEAFRAEFVDRVRRESELMQFFRHTLFKLCMFATPVFLLFFAIAPELFAFLFSPEYRDSGELSRYLCIGVFAQFISMPFSHVFVGTGRVRLGLIMQAGVSILPLLTLLIGSAHGGSLRTALLLSSLTTLLTGALMIVMAYQSCARHQRAREAGQRA